MENKYYQPNTEDFNIGVECQVYYPREEVWKDRKIRHWEDLNEILSRFITDNTSVRFKYLDEQDFLDCGYLLTEKPTEQKIYFRNSEDRTGITFRKNFYGDFSNIHIYEIRKPLITLFSGKIKNKNELQRILKQVEND